MVIDVDAKGAKFMITCPLWCNDLVNRLPSRRWVKSARAWAAPVLKMNVEVIRELSALPGVETTQGARDTLDTYNEKLAMLRGPKDGFPTWYKHKMPPLKHQQKALDRGYGVRSFALFMDMQTGKSKTAIDLTAAHRMEGQINGVLIFVKLSLRKNWVKQLALHCPIPYSVYLPTTDRESEFNTWLLMKHDFKIMVVGWESLSAGRMKDFCESFMLDPNRAVIGDETTYITSHKSGRAEVATKLARGARYVYALTGTPATEGPMNLYQQFEFLDPNIIGIGDYYAFRNRYAIMGGYMRPIGNTGKKVATEIIGYQNLDELMKMIAPHSFSFTKEEGYDLPPKRYEVRTVELTKEQRALYKEIKSDGIMRTKGGEEKVLQNVLEVALRLQQVTGGYGVTPREERYLGKDTAGNPIEKVRTHYEPYRIVEPATNPKMKELMEVVRESGKRQGIVWVVFKHEIRDIVGLMQAEGYKVGELHGDVKEFDRQPVVDAFERGEFQWIVGNASTGGMGYTMMASEVNIFYNNTFKAIDRLQAEDRAWGQGQTKSGIWVDIVADKTVDATVIKALEMKEDLQTYVRHRLTEVSQLLDGEGK